jgi:hypothetical protein
MVWVLMRRIGLLQLHEIAYADEGHVLLAVWSYLLYRSMETLMEKKGLDLPACRALSVIKEVRAVQVAIRDKAI